MKTYLIVTITCPDRPGIVERVTEAISGFGANWEDSRMARLGGDFAGIVKIAVDPQQVDDVCKALEALADGETTILVKKTTAEPVEPVPRESQLYRLQLSGADHEGIVHDLARFLAGCGINVESMDTAVVPAPMSASPVFQMDAEIRVPPSVSIDQLRSDLEEIAHRLAVDITLETDVQS